MADGKALSSSSSSYASGVPATPRASQPIATTAKGIPGSTVSIESSRQNGDELVLENQLASSRSPYVCYPEMRGESS